MEEPEATDLHSFMIFDINVPKGEGENPIIYWYYSKEEHAVDYQLTQVGLIITFVQFCKHFRPDDDCDYIKTSSSEISILKLYGDIHLSVSLKSKTSFNRHLLRSILEHAKMMFSHFWVPLPEFVSEDEPQPTIEDMKPHFDDAFMCLIQSINWEHLDSSYLFRSYTKQLINDESGTLENLCAELLLSHPNEISDIAILYKRHRIVHTTFSASVTRSLAFGMRKRFGHLFRHHPQTDVDSLTWIIGLYTDMNGMLSIYQPMVYIGGRGYLLVAFKLRNFKIVLTLTPGMEISEHSLTLIPKYLRNIRLYLKDRQPITHLRAIPVVFAYTAVYHSEQQMVFESKQIDAKSAVGLDINTTRANQFTASFGGKVAVAFPGVMSLYVYSIQNDQQLFVQCRTLKETVSDSLKVCNRIITTSQSERAPYRDQSCILT